MATGRTLVFAASAALLAAIPAAAHAASAGAPQPAATGAIAGGASSLAETLAAQGAAPRRVPPRPSGYGRPLPIAGAGRQVSPAVLSGKPDVFGTVALKVGRTPLDDKWRQVAQAPLTGPAAVLAESLRSQGERSRIEIINSYVNRRVRFADDIREHRRDDVWTTASETLQRGRGDCEDYAIAKLQMLRAAGFSDGDLYLVILKDLARRSDHAVTVVRSGDQMFVLDNGTDRLLESETVADYRPILTFAASGAWTHGYRVSSATLDVAEIRDSAPTLSPASK